MSNRDDDHDRKNGDSIAHEEDFGGDNVDDFGGYDGDDFGEDDGNHEDDEQALQIF